METRSRERRSLWAVDLGLGANLGLAVLKGVVGVVGRSPALFADAINSMSDVVYYVVVRVIMVHARKPADRDHPYGHERLESIGALIVGSFVVATGAAVLFDAVRRVYGPFSGLEEPEPAAQVALWVALFTVVVKLGLSAVTERAGRETSNPAVAALARDHRNDVWTAVAAALGIALSRAGHGWVDPAAAGVVGLVILATGVSILRESSADLMGTQPGRTRAQQIRGWLGEVAGVSSVQQIRAHSFGPYLVLNVTIGVDGGISVAEGDAIADEVERVLHERIEFLRAVHVHYHPVERQPPAPRLH